MGSKNLKGIVLAGSGAVAPANAQAFKKVKELMRQKIRQSPKWAEERRLYGTGADVMLMSRAGLLPTRNWQSGTFAQASGIAPTELGDFWPTKNVACAPFCISPCSHVVQIDRGPYRGATSEGPEYETIYVFGSNCGVARFDAIVAAEEICDAYGLDTMSTGAAIGFAMECFERGLIGREDTGGVELRFGDDRAMLEMVRQMATDTGFGSLLNRGVRHASRQIPGSERFAMHMKGMEPGGYECRAFWGQALQFALNSRGGCHHGFGLPARTEMAQGSGRRLEGKGQLVKSQAIDRILYDSIAICTFPRNALGQEVPLLLVNALLGTEFGPADLHRAGFRTLTLERLFNVREGISRKDDTLPPRLLEEPLPDGPGKGSTVPLAQLLDDGYQSLGWSAEGIPLPATLRELGLNWALQDLPGEPA